VSIAAPSLTLRALLKSMASRAGLGGSPELVTGLTASAQALAVASAAAVSPAVLVVPTDSDVEVMTSDTRFFFAALQGLPESEVVRAVLPFPSLEVDPYRAIVPHLDVASARARALIGLAQGTVRLVVASAPALLPRVTARERLLRATRELVLGGELSPSDLGDLLVDAGFMPEDPVDEHGEFCIRGGVVDFFPAGESYPIRVEFVGDFIESLRQFDPRSQRSVATIDRAAVIPLRETLEREREDLDAPEVLDRGSSVLEYLSATTTRTFVNDLEECDRRATRAVDQIGESYAAATKRGESPPDPTTLLIAWADIRAHLDGGGRFEMLGLDDDDALPHRPVACQPATAFHGRLGDWVETVRHSRSSGETQLFVAATPGRAERITELLQEYELSAVSIDLAETTQGVAMLVATGQLSRGFRLPDAGLQVYAETDLFDEERRVRDRRKSVATSFLSDLRDLKVGDQVVHVDHGIGGFVGLTQLDVGDTPHELMELRYAGGDKLFVPVEHLDLIQKYTGGQNPAFDRLGGASWERAKTRVKKAMRDMAGELLKLYAARKAVTGHGFSPDTHWQAEFEAAFEYDLTPDQTTAVADIKRDLEVPSPMDRLLCGDVGYGKTEVALRGAFKAVMDGKQVALLAPTTVLVFQHFKTIKERFAAFPVRVEMVSRFRSRAEQKAVLADLAAGKVDLIVGTHRLLSKDVEFHDLGLLVIDEEQRFGVAHKERIKTLRHKVDVLTMTATPIPRTLNMSLMGIRDMSVIETPPKDRLSIQTNVVKFDPSVVTRAIRTELDRGGQVYFVHNRIQSIASIADLIRRLVPEARLAVAHGQSSEAELEKAMIGFVAHEFDVLLSTTIIENGLDIPNVNTIIVNHADRYGLAQLYQLRGRVGRSNRRAYAYLLIPPEDNLSRVAQQRLAAIKEFSDLGSGFRVAALDLEIRGAGNLLGAEQSGQIEAIGFDMYVKLLERTVRELRGEAAGEERRATVTLGIELRIDEQYVPETNQRLALYRRVASAGDETELATLLDELSDRYGPVPRKVIRLIEFGRIRLMADRLGIESIDREKHLLVVKFRGDAPLDPVRLVALVEARPDVTLTPPAVIKVDLDVPRRRDQRRRRPPVDETTSWWTSRATSGRVTEGFTKQEVLNPDRVGADDEILAHVSGLLTELGAGD
jgi:transcription-repair coupling factor (superfamily II helicase)